MNLVTLLLILLIFGAFSGGHAGFYPVQYGYGGSGLLVLILVILLVTGRP